jgi:hypothetical protein
MLKKRISIFTGHFGSGKSEVAVNYAMKLAQNNKKVAIVDLDIVNPFFRTADVKNQLEDKGITVITPVYANTNIDVPALPPDINRVFEEKEFKVVFDVGGEDLGARVLSRYKEEIIIDDYEMFCVVNIRRPMTNTPYKIEEMIRSIEYSSRLKVSMLINNTNYLGASTIELLQSGQEMIKKVSEKINIPIGITSSLRNILEGNEKEFDTELLYLDKLIKLPWE